MWYLIHFPSTDSGSGLVVNLPTFEGDASLVESFSYRVWFSKQQRLWSLDQLGLPLRVHQE